MKYKKDFIDAFKNGNVDSFNQVFKDFVDPLYQYCYFRLSSKEDAEDLVEEIFTKIYKNMSNFDDLKSSLKTWIYSIARNTLIDFLRTRKDQNLELSDIIEDDKCDINSEANIIMNAESLKLAFKYLSDFEQQLIEMRFISDLSYIEISDITGKNSGALRVSMSRTLNKLKQVFTDMGISESNI